MKKKTSLIILVIVLICWIFLKNPQKAKNIEGELYCAFSNKIYKIDLDRLKSNVLYEEEGSFIDQISFFKKDVFILQKKNKEIYKFNILEKDSDFICEGKKPIYVREANSIFYYNKEALYRRSFESNVEEKITDDIYIFAPKELKSIYYDEPPVQISSQEIVFCNKDQKIVIYNFASKDKRILDFKGYHVWSGYGDMLVCKKNDNFYLLDIVTGNINRIKITPRWNVIFVKGYNCLIYSSVRFFSLSEAEDLFVYWIEEKKEEKLISNCYVSSGIYLGKKEGE
ncbi:MAG: hypothetical protein V1747_07080 [Candidatus Omnitrophota bacterium]